MKEILIFIAMLLVGFINGWVINDAVTSYCGETLANEEQSLRLMHSYKRGYIDAQLNNSNFEKDSVVWQHQVEQILEEK